MSHVNKIVCLQQKVTMNLIKELEVAKHLAHLFTIVWKLLKAKSLQRKRVDFSSRCNVALQIVLPWLCNICNSFRSKLITQEINISFFHSKHI